MPDVEAPLAQPPRARFPWRRTLPWALVGFVGIAVSLRTWWTGTTGWRGGGHIWPLLVPLMGAVGFVLTLIDWLRERRSDFLGEPTKRPTYVTVLVFSALWALTWPLGLVVQRASAEVSKARALEVAAAAEAYRGAVGRWPETVQEIEKRNGARLPRPTLGSHWSFLTGGDRLSIAFGTRTFVSSHTWQYDVHEKSWFEYESGGRGGPVETRGDGVPDAAD